MAGNARERTCQRVSGNSHGNTSGRRMHARVERGVRVEHKGQRPRPELARHTARKRGQRASLLRDLQFVVRNQW